MRTCAHTCMTCVCQNSLRCLCCLKWRIWQWHLLPPSRGVGWCTMTGRTLAGGPLSGPGSTTEQRGRTLYVMDIIIASEWLKNTYYGSFDKVPPPIIPLNKGQPVSLAHPNVSVILRFHHILHGNVYSLQLQSPHRDWWRCCDDCLTSTWPRCWSFVVRTVASWCPPVS